MAQTGYTPILIYSSSTTTNAPAAGNLTNSTLGSELAINITDGKLFYKDNGGSVQVIAWKTTPTTAGGTGLTSYTAGDLLYYASGTALTKLAIGATGRWLGSSGTAPQWNAPAALTKTDDTNVTLTLGGSASTALLNAASITVGWTGTLATSRGGTGLSSFTANGVVYASSTSALATGSALTFNGTDFANTGAITSTKAYVNTSDLGFVASANIPGWNLRASGGGRLSMVTGYIGNDISSLLCATGSSNPTTEVMRVTHSSANVSFVTGSVGIASGLSIGNGTPPGSVFAIGGSVLSSGAGTHFLKWSNVTGNVTYDTSSRLVKTDIEDSKYGLAEILKLRPRKYYRTDDQKIEHGLIADEVVDTMPEFVPMVPKSLLTKNEEDTELVPGGVNYERLVAPLINAIHELNAQIDALKLQIGK